MSKRFDVSFIIYLIISSFFINVEYKNLLFHILQIIPLLLLIIHYFRFYSKSASSEGFLVLLCLVYFIFYEIIRFFFSNTIFDPITIYLFSFGLLAVHVCFILIYRSKNARLLTFTKNDYYYVFPIMAVVFVVFGVSFLYTVPKQYIFLLMFIAITLSFLYAHIINRLAIGKSYVYGLIGGTFLAFTDLLSAYNVFNDNRLFFFTIYRITYFLAMLYLIKSLLPEGKSQFSNLQK